MAENNVILQVQDVTMQFGGLRAIDNVSFHVDEAEIFGLIGPNGAGKTTLFNVITANYKPTSGSVTLAGHVAEGAEAQPGGERRDRPHLPEYPPV